MTPNPANGQNIRQRLREIDALLEKMRLFPEASALRRALIESKALFEALLAAESTPD